MIYTVTLNPSIDYVIDVEDFQTGKVNRVKKENKYPGGKGVNISRVLNNAEIKNKALGFIGGFTGEYIKTCLENEGIDSDFITVDGDTRINVKLKSSKETEINGEGPMITNKDLNKLFQKINLLKSNDYLVLAGNIQRSLSRDIYSQMQSRCINRNIKVIIDTTGKALTLSLKYKPFLIKPNIHELEDIFNVTVRTKEEIIYYGKKLIEMGAQNVIISMAEKGALLISNEGVYHASAPKGVVKNSVGAGDSLVAGFLGSYSKTSNLQESFKWGVATGSATAFSLDLCKKEDVLNLINQVYIEQLI